MSFNRYVGVKAFYPYIAKLPSRFRNVAAISMHLSFAPFTHHLKTPFRIAHGAASKRDSVFVRLGEGVGEGAKVPYYPYTWDDLLGYLGALDVETLTPGGDFCLQSALDALPPGPAPARSALDIALHDHWGKTLGLPLWKLWGLDPRRMPLSSFTLSIPQSDADLDAAVAEVAHLPVLKLKVGTGDPGRDVEIVRRVRTHTDAVLGVDANSAWTVEEAARAVQELAEVGVAYVEQPVHRDDLDAWHRLRERLPDGLPPLIADEGVQSEADILRLHGGADGINLKLTKSGGLGGGRRWITLARSLGMKVMVGCMVESSVAVMAAAHLAPLCDFCDLDGPLLLRDDVVTERFPWHDGRILLPDAPGLGVTLRAGVVEG